MQRVGVRELNQETSKVLARVQRGESLEVTDRGRVIARLLPVEGGLSLLERLVAEGRAVRPEITGPIPEPPVLGDGSVDVADALTADRAEERW